MMVSPSLYVVLIKVKCATFSLLLHMSNEAILYHLEDILKLYSYDLNLFWNFGILSSDDVCVNGHLRVQYLKKKNQLISNGVNL